MNFRKFFFSAAALAFFAMAGVSTLSAQMSVSGLLDTSVTMRAGAGDAPALSCGIETYANLRMVARMREMATVFADVNLIALAGDPAFSASMAAGMSGGGALPTPFVQGANFIAGFELERLYFRVNTDNARLDGGLLRIPIGHGLVWRPTDFLNPANPILTNARPRAVLGAEFSWWPTFDAKFVGFGAAPRDPFERRWRGGHAGMTLEREWGRAVAQALYAFESPRDGADFGVHRAGLSVKADLEVGLVLDLLYSYNHERQTRLDGLAASVGFDYSLFRGSLLVVAEYLYSGANSSTSIGGGGHFANRHYLYTGFTWIFNDFTNFGLALVSGLSDLSFTPIATFNQEIFQGATLTLAAQAPFDRDALFGNGNRGELGPLPPDSLFPPGVAPFGRRFDFSAMLRLRF